MQVLHSVPGAVALACTSSSGIGPALPGCCRPRGSGPPGAEHVQPRQRASAGQVLARLTGVAGRPQGSGRPGAGRVQQRQRVGAGQVLAQLADVAGWVLQAAGVGVARRWVHPAEAAASTGRHSRNERTCLVQFLKIPLPCISVVSCLLPPSTVRKSCGIVEKLENKG